MRVLICGGRNYYKKYRVGEVIAELNPSVIIQGGATGADACAKSMALERGMLVNVTADQVNTHKRAAGPIRNRKMLEEGAPDLVVAYPGGAGTENMVSLALAARIPVRRET